MLSVLQQILAWGIILTIAVLYFKPIVLCFLLVRKNNVGLSFSGDLAEVEALLRRHPWKEEQELELRNAETENPHLYLSGYYTDITLHIKNGNLVGVSGAIVSLRRSYWEAYEVNQLLQYISRLSTDEGGGEADELREQTHAVLTNKKERDKAQKWLGRIVIFVEIVALALVLLYAKGKAEVPSSLVKNVVFSDFHYTKTVGSVLNSFDSDGEWFDVSEKNALKNNGVAYAGWQGACRSVSLLGTDENWPLTIYFELELADGGDSYYTSIDRIEFGQYSLLRSNLFQNSAIWDIMNMVYGNQSSAAVTADTGLFDVTYFLSKKDAAVSAGPEITPPPVQTAPSTPSAASAPEPAYDQPEAALGGYEAFFGTWGADDGTYLFIGYENESSQTVMANFSGAVDFEVELFWTDGVQTSGMVEGAGSDLAYSLSLEKTAADGISAKIYYGDEGVEDLLFFETIDPNTCPYQNPYFVPADMVFTGNQGSNDADYTGQYDDEDINLVLEPTAKEGAYSCTLYWYHGKSLEIGTAYWDTPSQLDGGTWITLNSVTDEHICITLEGDGFLYEDILLPKM